jgi:hypothetical protein
MLGNPSENTPGIKHRVLFLYLYIEFRPDIKLLLLVFGAIFYIL